MANRDRASPPDTASRRNRWRLPRPWPRSLAGQTVAVLLIGLTLSHLVSLGLYSIDRARLLQILGARTLVTRVVEAVERLETIDSHRESWILLRAMSDGRVRLRLSDWPMVPERTPDGDPETVAPKPPAICRFLDHALQEALDDGDAETPPMPVHINLADAFTGRPDVESARPPPWAMRPAPLPLATPNAPPDPSPDAGADRSCEPPFGRPFGAWFRSESQGDREHGFGPWRRGHDRDDAAPPGRFERWVVRDPQDQVLAVSVGLSDGSWLNVTARVPRPQGFWTPGALASIALMGIVILVLSLWAVRRLTRPLRAVADAARRMGQDPRMDPLPETGSRELRAVAAAFNEMRERLARLVDNRTRLLAAISHDLRTPITTLRLRAEFVEDAEERARMLATLDDMEAMVRATLDFARDDVTAEEARSLDLRALVEALCDDLAATGRDVVVEEAPAADPLVVRGRPRALRRAVANLVQNACAYAGAARVSVEAGSGTWAVTVRDDGPGIPEAHLARVTDPFYRVEGSRARETGGIGLGLSIVQAVADAHGGRLILANRPGGGLRARLEGPMGETRRKRGDG